MGDCATSNDSKKNKKQKKKLMNITPMSVTLIDRMGSDQSVVNAARVSFAKEIDEITDKDVGLINYLAKHNHWTPFGHAFLSFRVKAPIFVARQLVKHQVGLVWNEVSRRYVSDEPEFWFPKVLRCKPTGSVKQGSEGVHEHSEAFIAGMHVQCHEALALYNGLIENGVAPEQARMILPLNAHTEWIWSGSLMAFARVCKLRLDPHAQAETREIAEQINAQVPEDFNFSWAALMGDK